MTALLLFLLKWFLLAIGGIVIICIVLLIAFLWFDALVDKVAEEERLDKE